MGRRAGHPQDPGGQVTRRTPSHGRARGCAGLLQPQRFTQPAGKIHFFHLGALDEGVALEGGEARQEGHGRPTAAHGVAGEVGSSAPVTAQHGPCGASHALRGTALPPAPRRPEHPHREARKVPRHHPLSPTVAPGREHRIWNGRSVCEDSKSPTRSVCSGSHGPGEPPKALTLGSRG